MARSGTIRRLQALSVREGSHGRDRMEHCDGAIHPPQVSEFWSPSPSRVKLGKERQWERIVQGAEHPQVHGRDGSRVTNHMTAALPRLLAVLAMEIWYSRSSARWFSPIRLSRASHRVGNIGVARAMCTLARSPAPSARTPAALAARRRPYPHPVSYAASYSTRRDAERRQTRQAGRFRHGY
jgi:hypothetical protein